MIVKTSARTADSSTESSQWTGAGGWMTTGQVAKRLGYSRSWVHAQCVAGKIPAQQIKGGGKYRIPIEWVLAQIKPVIRRQVSESDT